MIVLSAEIATPAGFAIQAGLLASMRGALDFVPTLLRFRVGDGLHARFLRHDQRFTFADRSALEQAPEQRRRAFVGDGAGVPSVSLDDVEQRDRQRGHQAVFGAAGRLVEAALVHEAASSVLGGGGPQEGRDAVKVG